MLTAGYQALCRYRAIWLSIPAAVLLAVLALALGAAPHAAELSGEDLALDYLIQKVCLDPSGKVLLVDPYYCPAGGTLRALAPGEALPYHRYDQAVPSEPNSRQRRDSYPVRSRDGREIVVNTFDHAPFGQFKPDRDGYDITMVRDGWASIGGTRGGPRSGGTTFFGAGCKPYGGWVLFPVSALDGRLIKPGEARAPIQGVHWERNGQPWPGDCPRSYQTKPLTSWEPVPAFRFGGLGGAPVKSIDAVRSIHGFIDSPRFFARGHLEVFYFTRIYGFTRWEGWVTAQRYKADPAIRRRAAVASARCIGPAENVYKGITFERVDCRDWTSVTVLAAPEAAPAWPVPYLN